MTLLELVLKAAQTCERRGVSALGDIHGRMVILGNQCRQLTESLRDDVEDGAIGGERDILHQPGHSEARLSPEAPGIRRQFSADDLKKSGFAAPVTADEAHALPRLDLKRDIVEEWKVAEGDGDVIERDERHYLRTYHEAHEGHEVHEGLY